MFKSISALSTAPLPSTPAAKPCVGVDWGTSQRRAYALDAQQGNCTAEYADTEGALACRGRFPAALHHALTQLDTFAMPNDDPIPVILSGMVGSALGWQEAPYVTSQVSLEHLAQHLQPVVHSPAGTQCFIVPGYCVRNAQGQPDVMRGEETQLLGAVTQGHRDGWFVLPGTHSKWVKLIDGRIDQLRTYMTGELFNLLSQHGTLAAAAQDNPHSSAWDASAFAQGVQAASFGGALSHLLFGVRASVVSGDRPSSSAKAYLSGVLIGCELHSVLHSAVTEGADTTQFKLIGSPELATHYQAAAAQLQVQFDIVDAQSAYIAAVHHLQRNRTAG